MPYFLSLFCTFWTLSFTDLRCIDSWYLVIATSHTILNRLFETLHMFSLGSAEVHMVWIWFLNLFLSFFHFNFVIFLTSDFMKVYRLWVLIEPNFSCIIWEHAYLFLLPEINITFFWMVWGRGEGGRCDINFTEVWSSFGYMYFTVMFYR